MRDASLLTTVPAEQDSDQMIAAGQETGCSPNMHLQRSSFLVLQQEGVRYRSALTPLAQTLAPGEILEIEFENLDGQPGTGHVLLSLAMPLSVPDASEHAPDCKASAAAILLRRFALPGVDLIQHTVRSQANFVEIPVPFRPLRVAQPTGRPAGETTCPHHQKQLRSIPATTCLIGLPTIGLERIDVTTLIAALSETGVPFSFRVQIERFELGVADHLKVGRAIRQPRPSMHDFFDDPMGSNAQVQDLSLLVRWSNSQGGWRFRFLLAIPGLRGSHGTAQQVAARFLFSTTSSAMKTAASSSDFLDFSASLPFSASVPEFLPSAMELSACGFTRRIRDARIAVGSVADHSAVALGVDRAGHHIGVLRPDLQRHMLILGSSGVGKSTLMRRMISQDLRAGIPVIMVDPHGDLFVDVAAEVEATDAPIPLLIDLNKPDEVPGLEFLRPSALDPQKSANLAANELILLLRKTLYRDSPEAFGPMFESYMRNAVLLLLLSSAPEVSFCDLDRVFHDAPFRRSLLASCKDPLVVRFWEGIAVRAGGEASLENITPYITSKLTQLTGNPVIRPMISGERPSADLSAAMEAGRPVLVNLAKGSIGRSDAVLVGALFTAELMRILMMRCTQARTGRRIARIYLDEFQTYSTDTLAQLMAEGRKTGAEMVLATQDMTSFGGGDVRQNVAGSILTNCGNLAAFRSGPRDAALLSEWLGGATEVSDLMRLPDRHFVLRSLRQGVPLDGVVVRLAET